MLFQQTSDGTPDKGPKQDYIRPLLSMTMLKFRGSQNVQLFLYAHSSECFCSALLCFLYILNGVLGGFALIVSSPDELFAADRIGLFGVHLHCPGCELKEEGECKVIRDFGARETPCLAVFEELLNQTLVRGTLLPEPTELRRFVLTGKTSKKAAALGLQLLSRSEEGRRLIEKDAALLSADQPEAVEHLLTQAEPSKPILDAFYKLPRQKSSEFVRGLVVAADRLRGSDALLKDLAGIDLKSDAQDLSEYRRAFERSKMSEPARFERLRTVVEACRNANNSEFLSRCLLARENPKSEAGKYLVRMQRNAAKERMAAGDVPLSMKISWLSGLETQFGRNSETLMLFRKCLEELLNAPYEAQLALYREGKLDFLRIISQLDREAAGLYGLFLVRFSASAWDAGQRQDSTRALLESYEVFPSELAARKSLLEKVSLLLPRHEKWFSEIWERLSPEAKTELNALPGQGVRAIETIVRAGFLLLLGLGAVLAFLVLRNRREQRGPGAKGKERVQGVNGARSFDGRALARDQLELKELLDYFELGMKANEAALIRAYRRKAKVLHPDTLSGTNAEFSRLTERFQRAKVLLAQVSKFTEGKEDSIQKKRGII